MAGKKTTIKIMLPIMILVSGVIGMQLMALSNQTPEKKERSDPGFVVETLSVTQTLERVMIKATGTVQPSQRVDIIPQVSGRVIHLAPGFVTGGFFKQDDILFEIDPSDYQLAAEQSRAGVAQAEYELARVESQARIAKQEWDRVTLTDKRTPSALLMYKPQLKNARAKLTSAEANLARRLLDIERTRIAAPFDGLIQSESLDLGQHLTAGKSVGQIIGTSEAEIIAPVSLDDFAWLQIPRQNSGISTGSPASVRLTVGKRTYTWPGHIDRRLGEVDPEGRMARLVVQVADPYNLSGSQDRPPIDLAIGLFVDVWLHGKNIPDVFAIPSGALRDNQTVWIMDPRSELEIRPVQVLYRKRETVLIDEGLAPGDRVILTQVTGAAPKMKLRVRNGEDIQ